MHEHGSRFTGHENVEPKPAVGIDINRTIAKGRLTAIDSPHADIASYSLSHRSEAPCSGDAIVVVLQAGGDGGEEGGKEG